MLADRTLIHPLHNLLLQRAKRTYLGDAVPRVGRARLTADRFVPLEETRHEEFLRQGGQLDAAPGAVRDELISLFRIHHAEYGARLRRVVIDREILFRPQRDA